jgi:hypothetical protein
MSIDHRSVVDHLLDAASEERLKPDGDPTHLIATAQVHATLARDEDQAATTADLKEALHSLRRRFNDTRSLVSTHIAQGLASREKDRWKAAIDLTKALDEAHCNLDHLVDARLEDDGWDPRSAYKTPAGLTPAGWAGAAAERDPWAPTPDITAAIPEPVRRVIAERVADMLLDQRDEWHAEQGRRLAFALKNEGADLTEAIKQRITELTLGRDPSDPPF